MESAPASPAADEEALDAVFSLDGRGLFDPGFAIPSDTEAGEGVADGLGGPGGELAAAGSGATAAGGGGVAAGGGGSAGAGQPGGGSATQQSNEGQEALFRAALAGAFRGPAFPDAPGRVEVSSSAGPAPSAPLAPPTMSAAAWTAADLTRDLSPGGSTGVTTSAEDASARAAANEALGRLPLRFEENVGQFRSSVDFMVRGAGFEAGLSAGGVQYVLPTAAAADDPADTGSRIAPPAVVSMELVGANTDALAVGQDLLPGVTNYLVGDDPSRHFRDVASYASVAYAGVYEGVDLVYHASPEKQLEYDFVVAPGASPDAIALKFGGAEAAHIDETGALVLTTGAGEVRQERPVSYQDVDGVRREVDSHFVLGADGTVRFDVGAHDRTRALVIDPKWGYSSYLGTTLLDSAEAVAVDATGAAYVVGLTYGGLFGGAPDSTFLGNPLDQDAFVAKIDPTGNQVVFVTIFGGSGRDDAMGVALANVGEGQIGIFITGTTNSNNFYLKAAWQNQIGGEYDAFVTRLKPAGDDAEYSTFVGGPGSEQGRDIAVDAQLKAYAAGQIIGYNAQVRVNGKAADEIGPTGGADDVLIVRLDATGVLDQLIVMGGAGEPNFEAANGIAVDDAAVPNIYVVGYTNAPDGANTRFPTTAGAYRRTIQGVTDAFVAKIQPRLNAQTPPTQVYATLFGGVGEENAADIGIDRSDNNVYVVGSTTTKSAASFISEANVKLPPIVLGDNDSKDNKEGWVARFDAAGRPDTQNKTWFVYFAGKKEDSLSGISLYSPGQGNLKLFVGGTTFSNDGTDKFPNKGTLQKFRGRSDAFLAYLDPSKSDATTLLYVTYVGGSGEDESHGVAADTEGKASLVGDTRSQNLRPGEVVPIPGFRVTPNKPVGQGFSGDGFIVKILPDDNRRTSLQPVGDKTAIVGTALTFTASASDPDSDTVNYGLFAAPTGATISSSGAFSWTPSTSQGPAVYSFFVQASDPYGGFDEEAISATVAPSVGATDLPGDTLSAALPVYPFQDVKAQTLAQIGDGNYGDKDVDFYRVDLNQGETLLADIDALQVDDGGPPLSQLNSLLMIFAPNGNVAAGNDSGIDPDTGLWSEDAVASYTVPVGGAGTYYVGVSGSPNNNYNPLVGGSGSSGSQGAYRLQLTVSPPDASTP